jgi:hypothetical protein
MISKATSPSVIPSLEEQLLSLRKRRSVVDRLIRCLQAYELSRPQRNYKKRDRVA